MDIFGLLLCGRLRSDPPEEDPEMSIWVNDIKNITPGKKKLERKKRKDSQASCHLRQMSWSPGGNGNMSYFWVVLGRGAGLPDCSYSLVIG